jgi:hypothetical protein
MLCQLACMWGSDTRGPRARTPRGGGPPHRPSVRSSVVRAVDRRSAIPWSISHVWRGTSTPKGFEPLRAEHNGFLVHYLHHSVTGSCSDAQDAALDVPHASSPTDTPSLGAGRSRGETDRKLDGGITDQHGCSTGRRILALPQQGYRGSLGTIAKSVKKKPWHPRVYPVA